MMGFLGFAIQMEIVRSRVYDLWICRRRGVWFAKMLKGEWFEFVFFECIAPF